VCAANVNGTAWTVDLTELGYLIRNGSFCVYISIREVHDTFWAEIETETLQVAKDVW